MHLIYDRVLAFIADPQADDFGELALAVFRHQMENCPAYRRYCESRGTEIAAVSTWQEIPAVPIEAFKWADLTCGPAQRVFLSTGTTQGSARRSRHALPDLRLYRAAAIGGLRRFLFPDLERIDVVSMIPPAAERPDSSLAQMVGWAGEVFGRDGVADTVNGGELNLARLTELLRDSERRGAPIAILTTTGALIHFLDHVAARGLSFRLPHGSRLMDTGGDKGAPRRLSRRGLMHAVWNAMAIPGYFMVNEYGMAELSSQHFDSVVSDRFHGIHRPRQLAAPKWARTLVLDMATRRPLPPGEAGLICHFDLANAGTAMAVLSEDVGVCDGNGLRLRGRAPRAEVRGCSLASAEWHVA